MESIHGESLYFILFTLDGLTHFLTLTISHSLSHSHSHSFSLSPQEDEALPGRYKLIKETPSRPGGMALDFILQEASGVGGQEVGPDGKVQVGFLGQIQNVVTSMRYFMKSLGN